MIVKIIYNKNKEVFFEGDRIYKDYSTSDDFIQENKGLEFIDLNSSKSLIRISIWEKDEIKQTLYTNEKVYLLNDSGKTIEKLN